MADGILASYFQTPDQIQWERSANFIHRIYYHLILFTPKFRALITPEIAAELEDIFKEITTTKGYELLGMVIQPNHAHLILKVKPTHFIPAVVKDIRERTSFLTMSRHKDIQKKHKIKKLWSRNFGVETLAGFNFVRLKNQLLDWKAHPVIDAWEKHFRAGNAFRTPAHSF